MADSRFIIFPCDHKSWPNVRAILTVGKASRTTESWIATFQRAHDVLHTDPGEAASSTGAKSKTRNVFSGLRMFLDLKTTLEESYQYIDHVFPQIVELVLEIESLRPKNGLEILRQRREEVRVISKRLAASIVSCAFLCLFPGRCPSHIAGLQQSSRLSVFSFDDFFLHLDSDFQCEKLRYILRYFSTASELHSRPLGNLAFSRKVLQIDDVPKPEEWMCSAQPLCPVVVHTGSALASSDSSSAETVQVVFGSRHYGRSALGSGRTQEDVWFCERAELLSGMLFSECLSDGEVFYVSGVDLPGGGPLVHPKVTVPGSAAAVYASSDNPTQEVMSRHGTSVCIIDSSADEICHPYRQRTILGFLSRMLTGLCSEGSAIRPMDNLALASGNSDADILGGTESSSALEDDGAEETSETDLRLSSESLSSSSVAVPRLLALKSSQSFAHESGPRPLLHRARPTRNTSSWRSNSSTDSSGSLPDSLSRAMSLEVDSCPTPDDTPPTTTFARRRSGQSSRRGSMLQGQSSFASESGDLPSGFSGCSRRRSSGMSDMSRRSSSSSGSSAGKRSSTDYSSEMEEYCENFQRSIIKTSVIEEESGAMSLMEESGHGAAAAEAAFEATTSEPTNVSTARSRIIQKFSVDRPKDVAKPKPIKGGVPPPSSGASTILTPFSVNLTSVPCSPTALDHFVDNLINEVAQDSKLEIEELVREQRVNQLLGIAKEESAVASSAAMASSADTSVQGSAPFRLIENFDVKTAKQSKPAETSNELEETRQRKIQLDEMSTFSTALEKAAPLAHCHSCKQAKEELDEFVTEFLNSVFLEAVDVYCHHFGSSDGRRRQSHVEEIWIAPTSHRHSVPNLSDQRPFQKTESELPGTVGRVRRTLEQFSSQSYDEDVHRLHPPSTSGRAGSLLSELSMQVGGGKTFFGTAKFNSQLSQCPVHGSEIVCHPSSREYLLGLFSTSSGLCMEQPPTFMDWYVQDLLMDAFDEALVELLGKSSLQNQLQASQPGLQGSKPGETTEEALCAGLLRFADDMARKIITVSEREAAQHTAVAGSASCRSDAHAGAHSGMYFSRWPQPFDGKTPLGLEEIASEFANQLIDEAVHIVAGSEPLQRVKRSVIAEHSADGAFGQEPELLALLQWIGASASLASELHYDITGNTQISQMDVICQIILSRELTVGSLLSEILVWCRNKREKRSEFESLFNFLLSRLT